LDAEVDLQMEGDLDSLDGVDLDGDVDMESKGDNQLQNDEQE
jgi:hypothetical protein